MINLHQDDRMPKTPTSTTIDIGAAYCYFVILSMVHLFDLFLSLHSLKQFVFICLIHEILVIILSLCLLMKMIENQPNKFGKVRWYKLKLTCASLHLEVVGKWLLVNERTCIYLYSRIYWGHKSYMTGDAHPQYSINITPKTLKQLV